jgi:hypothetical protein
MHNVCTQQQWALRFDHLNATVMIESGAAGGFKVRFEGDELANRRQARIYIVVRIGRRKEVLAKWPRKAGVGE